VRDNTGSKHALQAVLDDYFPELKGVFWSMKSKGLMALLETHPFPEDVLQAGLPAITALLVKSTKRKAHARAKAETIYRAAKESVGLKTIGTADHLRLGVYLDEVKRSEERLKEIGHQITNLLNLTWAQASRQHCGMHRAFSTPPSASSSPSAPRPAPSWRY
jgi:transposase